MKKYTFIFEFRGGTYISQVIAKSVNKAIESWASNIDVDGIKFMGQAGKHELINQLDPPDPILINGMDNVWCISGVIKMGFFLTNIVMS